MRIWLTVGFAAMYTPVWAAMPAAEQNALVRKYCAVCHTDAAMNGGLSLQHYDAAKRDPGLAAMILSKLNNGAMGAAGNGVPDKVAQQAWLDSTREQANGAKEWFGSHEDGVVSASIVREVPPRKPDSTDVPVYRVRMVCNPPIGVGEMQLTWSPQPQTGRTITAVHSQTGVVELDAQRARLDLEIFRFLGGIDLGQQFPEFGREDPPARLRATDDLDEGLAVLKRPSGHNRLAALAEPRNDLIMLTF